MSEVAKQLIEKEKRERTGKLDLSFKNLSKILVEIAELTSLTSLDLRNNGISVRKPSYDLKS